MILDVLYRGPLMSCNYDCWYCPFAKKKDDSARQQKDQDSLTEFINWITKHPHISFRIFFTPWGEALTRSWYRDALVTLSNIDHVKKISIQSNGAWPHQWLDNANRSKLQFWLTFHPSQIKSKLFIDRCMEIKRIGFDFSVGCVGIREDLPMLLSLRNELDLSITMWVNAYHDGGPNYYTADHINKILSIDPYFMHNLEKHKSLGKKCRAGSLAISVNGEGDIRRCHFIDEIIGNIHDDEWADSLKERTCPQPQCNCYIGYANLEQPEMDSLYGDNLWSRIPL